MTWRIRVLGEVSLSAGAKRLLPERKTAALLAYVALEGAASRSRLAGLLWPDSPEERARGNLRQLLRRLRAAAGEDLIEASDQVRLQPQVEIDVIELQASAVTEGVALGAAYMGDLLAGHEYDDCPELLEWLTAQQERLAVLRRELLLDEIDRLQRQRDYQAALRLAERLIEIDPLSEEPYRKLMRLHYLAGDRAAALQVYGRCREVLQRELGVDPLSETAALAKEIADEAATLPERAGRQELPLSLERPLLVGRDREWNALQSGWDGGRLVILTGEPGTGKTRLANDFAASHGRYLRLAARPGDAGVSYALFTRAWRDLLEREPHLEPLTWARGELARLLPELGPSPSREASGKDGEKARLLEAMAEQLQVIARAGRSRVLVDDLQYADDASFEALCYLLAEQRPLKLDWLLCYRRGELAGDREAQLRRLITHGAVLVELEPLTVEAVSDLLRSLPLATSEGLAGPLTKYTGGNPLFITETLKSLAESNALQRPFPERLAPPRELRAVIDYRLERLSPAALRLARAAAVLDESFELEAAGQLLGGDPLELAAPLVELEGARVVGENGLSHDLVREAVYEGTPSAVRRLLHQRTARYLEGLPVPPGQVARHYLASGDERRAAPFLEESAQAAAGAYRLADAVDSYRQAAALFERQGEFERAFEVLNSAATLLLKSEYGPGHGEVERALFRLARSPAQLAVAWQTRSIFLQLLAKAEESEAAAREGHRFALAAGDLPLQLDLLNNVVGALWLQDRIGETTEILARAIELGERLDDPLRLSEGLSNMGVILDHLDRHREALEYHRRAEALRARHGERLGQVQVMGNLSVSQAELGLASDSLATARRMLVLLEEVDGANDLRVHACLAAGAALRDLGDFPPALEQLTQALRLAVELNTWIVGPVRRHLALTYSFLGRHDEGRELLEFSLAQQDTPRQFRGADLQAMAVIRLQKDEDPTELLVEAEELLGEQGRPLRRGNLLLVKALALPAEQGLSASLEALDLARRNELCGLLVAANTRCAENYLSLGMVEEAVNHAREAAEHSRIYTPADFYLGEVYAVHYRSLAAAASREAPAASRFALGWVERAAAKLNSEDARRRFLEGNRVNRELMIVADGEVGRRAGFMRDGG